MHAMFSYSCFHAARILLTADYLTVGSQSVNTARYDPPVGEVSASLNEFLDYHVLIRTLHELTLMTRNHIAM